MKKVNLLSLGILIFSCALFSRSNAQTTQANAADSVLSKPKVEIDRFVNNQPSERNISLIDLKVKEIFTRTEKKVMSKGEQLAIIVSIPEASLKTVQSNWEKIIKNKTKAKVQKEQDEVWISNTSIPEVYQEPIGVYGKFISTTEGIDLAAFFEVDSTFIEPENYGDQITSASEFLRKFGINQYKLAVESQLKEEQKNLKNLQQRLGKLQKENEKMHTSIKANESNILNQESDIEINLSDQRRKTNQLENQKLENDSYTMDAEQKKQAKKALKERDKERKKLQKKNQNMHKNIAGYRAAIENSRRAIQLNLDQQAIEDKAIKEKTILIRSIENKLLKIK